MPFALSIAVSGAVLLAQASAVPPPVSGLIDTPHLTIATSTSSPVVAPGGRVSLLVDVTPKPTMHVYSPEQKVYLPVSVRLDASPGVTAGPATFPKGEVFFFAPTKETQIVYSKVFRIDQRVTVRRGRASGPLAITGTLVYQACDDSVCYVPRTVPIRWTLQVR